MHRYEPRGYEGDVLLLTARERSRDTPPDLGWSALLHRLERHDVPGDHFSLLRAPHVRAVAERLAEPTARPSGREDMA